jgi:hypothetical protein
MIYELRIYKPVPGKKAELHKRFSGHLLRLFSKHGMVLVGVWDPVVGEQLNLVYMLKFESMDARERAWRSLFSDPEWHEVREASEAQGPLIAEIESSLLAPAAYSPLP